MDEPAPADGYTNKNSSDEILAAAEKGWRNPKDNQTNCALCEREVVLKVRRGSPLSQAHVDNEASLLTIDMKNSVVCVGPSCGWPWTKDNVSVKGVSPLYNRRQVRWRAYTRRWSCERIPSPKKR